MKSGQVRDAHNRTVLQAIFWSAVGALIVIITMLYDQTINQRIDRSERQTRRDLTAHVEARLAGGANNAERAVD